MTGFGYLLLSSGLDVDEVAELCGVDEDEIEAWCKGRKEIPVEKLSFITDRGEFDTNLLKREVSSFNREEETKVYTAGVVIGVLLNKDIMGA